MASTKPIGRSSGWRTPKPRKPHRRRPVAPWPAPLTPREREVVTLLARGRTVKEAAIALGISYRTADTHTTNAMLKMNVKHRGALIVWAIVHGLVSLDELSAPYEINAS